MYPDTPERYCPDGKEHEIDATSIAVADRGRIGPIVDFVCKNCGRQGSATITKEDEMWCED